MMENELIKVSENENGELLVSARELHEFLEISRNFTTWFKRMCEYGYDENVDFVTIWSDSKNGNAVSYLGSPQKMSAKGYVVNYALKIDMAKELSMIQRNEKGKQTRQYFIECEKQLTSQVPQLSRKETLQLQLFSKDPLEVANAHTELVQIEIAEATKPLIETIEEQKPDVDFANAIKTSETNIKIGDFSKMTTLGRTKLFEFLRENKILMKTNLPYQTYIDRNYFAVTELSKNGMIFPTTLITPKGQQWLLNNYPELIRE